MSVQSQSASPAAASSNAPLYSQAFRRHVHQLILMGYQRLDAPTFRDWDEPDISGELVRAIEEAMEARDAPRWASRYAIHDDPPQHGRGRLGKARRRVDIAVERAQAAPRPRFQFEAKRLRDRSSVGEYLGAPGLGRFLSGEYAAQYPMAGMLGYVQIESEAAWAGGIEGRLRQCPMGYAVRSNGQWARTNIVPGWEHIYTTGHDRRVPLPPILISHVFLLFC